MVVGQREEARPVTLTLQDRPVAGMPISVADKGIKHEVASEHSESGESEHAGWWLDMLETC